MPDFRPIQDPRPHLSNGQSDLLDFKAKHELAGPEVVFAEEKDPTDIVFFDQPPSFIPYLSGGPAGPKRLWYLYMRAMTTDALGNHDPGRSP